jgi:hypothetical protein
MINPLIKLSKLSLVVAAAATVWTGTAWAQAVSAEHAELRQQIERRFEVLPLRDGIMLQPRSPASGVRSIEITDGPIAIDGVAATGAELRAKLGADADAVLQLSYLDAAARRALFRLVPPAVPSASQPTLTPAAPEPPVVPDSRRRRENRRGDRVRIGGSVTVDEDEVVAGNVVAVGGSARVRGEVRGDVVAVGGSVDLGPRAVVSQDVVVVGGALRREPGSVIEGQLHEVGFGDIDFGDWRWRWGSTPFAWPWLGRTFALMSTAGRIAILCLLAAVVLLLGREDIERISARAAAEPLKAGAIGILAQLLFLPVLIVTIVILVATIVGIPLLLLIPFALVGLGIVALVGFTGVAYRLGGLVGSRCGWNLPGPYAATIIGILVIVSPLLLARLLAFIGGPIFPMTLGLGIIAFLAEYLVWTVGFGAVALVWYNRPRATPPPMVPPPIVP